MFKLKLRHFKIIERVKSRGFSIGFFIVFFSALVVFLFFRYAGEVKAFVYTWGKYTYYGTGKLRGYSGVSDQGFGFDFWRVDNSTGRICQYVAYCNDAVTPNGCRTALHCSSPGSNDYGDITYRRKEDKVCRYALNSFCEESVIGLIKAKSEENNSSGLGNSGVDCTSLENCSLVFYKSIRSHSNPISIDQPDSDIGDQEAENGERAEELVIREKVETVDQDGNIVTFNDVTVSGLVDHFFATGGPTKLYQKGVKEECSPTDIRNYAYIYIPTGWWSFGLKSDQQENNCYYCPLGNDGKPLYFCNGDATDQQLEAMRINYCKSGSCGANEENGRCQLNCNNSISEALSCGKFCSTYRADSCNSFCALSKNHICLNSYNYNECKHNCGGKIYSWIGAAGEGTSASPYSPPDTSGATNLAQRIKKVGEKNQWRSLVNINNDAVDRQMVAQNYNGNFVNVSWSPPKYYTAGWYPVQMSGDPNTQYFSTFRFYWKKYNPSANTYGPEMEYYNGNGQARISACHPGQNPDCSCELSTINSFISGEERKDVLLATLSNYGSPVDVVSSNPSVLEVKSSGVTSDGKVTATLLAKNVDDITTVNIEVKAPGTNESAMSCGSTDVPCSIAVSVYPGKFWQAKNADVIAKRTIKSLLNSNDIYFNLKGSDSPGIPFYGGSLNLGQGVVSEKGWKVKTDLSSSFSNYNYSYFEKLVPSEVKAKWDEGGGVINNPSGNLSWDSLISNSINVGGYYWTKVEGNISTGSLYCSNGGKLILFVKGNLTIKRNISLGSKCFLMVIVSGDINVDPEVSSIEGIFIANNFSTGTKGARLDGELSVKGTVIANLVYLRRSLPTNLARTKPAEIFEYNPSLIFMIPYQFNQRRFNWREVNP